MRKLKKPVFGVLYNATFWGELGAAIVFFAALALLALGLGMFEGG